MKDINDFYLTPRTMTPSYPGIDRALLQYAWVPFYDGNDVITITSGSQQGIKSEIASLLGIK